jgi:hypothetical protein
VTRRPPLRALVAIAVAACVVPLGTAPAQTPTPPAQPTPQPQPPDNDNYLFSTITADADGNLPLEFADGVDTTAATTQTDLFLPNPDGRPVGGGGPERTSCGGTSFGRTVWYDFTPPTDGGVFIQAAGFDTVVSLYEWDDRTNLITRRVTCSDASNGPTEQILPNVVGGRRYTVQIGGAGGIGGLLDYAFSFFPDRDSDGILDSQPDRCPDTPGIIDAGGCPPRVGGNAAIAFDRAAGGITVTRLVVNRVPRGSRVIARCRGCSPRATQRRRARRFGTIRLTRFDERFARAGARLEIFVTHGPAPRGRFRFGAVGLYFAYPVRNGAIGARVEQCLPPGSLRPVRCSRVNRELG